MDIGEAYPDNPSEMEEESESEELDPSDDSDDDPSFDVLEEIQSSLSKLSIKKARSRGLKIDSVNFEGGKDEVAVADDIPKLDEKSFELVKQLIEGGQLEKLKLDQCKVYLRKYGLRLAGTKGVLISRIKEHQEIIDGNGEKKYPLESFVLNCKGDACLGDVVIFEQNVYNMFDIPSRSSRGIPPCGTRTVAGRIIKESYGVAKQQHTFTIEVLWSKGEKPLPPLHQLLIKGRNLYRIKTMRQRWADEGERLKVLQEKHRRGSLARNSREMRIQRKEKRKNPAAAPITVTDKENRNPLTIHNNVQQMNVANSKQQQYKHEHSVRSNAITQPQQQQPPLLQSFQRTYAGSQRHHHHHQHHRHDSRHHFAVRHYGFHASHRAHQHHHMARPPQPLHHGFHQHRSFYTPHGMYVLLPSEQHRPEYHGLQK